MTHALSFPVLTAEMSHVAAQFVWYTVLGVTFYIDTVHILQNCYMADLICCPESSIC